MQSINCQQCKSSFTITSEDRQLLGMLAVPEPTFCPRCRSIRRAVFRNERSLYKRACDLCKKESIMMYPTKTPFPVYCKPCWWSDSWTAADFAREYDFSKPFFAQMHELMLAVPRPGVIHQGNIINSEYTNRVTDMRNCYLVFGTTNAEYSRYSTTINGSKECQDCYATIKSEKCYECTDSTNCYELAFSRDCTNCRNSWFLQNCVNCSNCFGCVNLRNKQYCIFNEQYSKEEYEKKIAGFNLHSAKSVETVRAQFAEFKKKFIVPALVTRRSVDSSGNWVEDCKNVTQSFNCQNVEDGRHCYNMFTAKTVMDYSQWGAASEKIYESVNCGMQLGNVHFGNECWIQLMDSEYVMNCHNSKNLFACIGIRNSEYRILNKQYSKEEYVQLVGKIKKQMDELPYTDAAGRVYKYGEFFPIELSPHAYNETGAQEFYPITKEEAIKNHFPWKEPESRKYAVTLQAKDLPDSIHDADDGLLKEVISCEHEGRCDHGCTTALRLIPEELAMYKTAGLPLPRLCHNCRYHLRIRERNPFALWPRSCQCPGSKIHEHGENACINKFETSYAPDRPEKVYCIQCYQQEVG